ncbi:uncharacterized protein LOC133655146 isoform X2 [Entelurus aequoreus]|uniref:uncharacterized protein LOC133655146 isoform X2 n=1 Tax=Entelurus aequoreus TaxID=161455 RepID=UPI002B1D403B|nr:uncharacterized protein LOC133655146 isoform X2 [Entelurus aequoreus]XP_061911069.1 uncharacterized protein LOC133655146 isoform X2 [Entelurus aequoreus]
MVCLKLSSLTRALNSRKRVMEVLPNNMVRLETLDGKPKHMMTPYASLKPLRPRTHPGWPKDSPSAPVLPGDAEMLTSSSEEETECHCFTDHTYAGPTSPWKKELHPDQKQLLEYVLACDRPAMELIVKEGGVCLTREEFWSLGLSRDMDSTIGNACLQLVQEAAQRHGKDVFIANMYIVPTWKHKDVDPMSSLPRDAHLKDALLFPAWSKHNITFSVSIAQHIIPGSWSELTGKDMQEIPRQTSGNDCGVFMLMYSLWLCTDTTFHYSVLDMQSIRRWWCVLLMERFGIEGWRLVQGVPCLPPECS